MSERFERFTNLLSGCASRRILVAGALGSLAAPGLRMLGDDSTGAKKKKKKKCKCGACQECRRGRCISKDDDSRCNEDGRCRSGTCNPRPTCTSAGFGCDLADPATCCSTVCNPTGPFNAACQPGGPGQECLVNDDCASATCVGYRCRSLG